MWRLAANDHPPLLEGLRPENAPRGAEISIVKRAVEAFSETHEVPYIWDTISLNQVGLSNKTYSKIRVVMGIGITVSIIAKMIRKSSILVLIFIMYNGSRLLRNDIALHMGVLVEICEFAKDSIDQAFFMF
jgi:hypothetical protein